MCPIKYYTHVLLQDDLRSLRRHLVLYARLNGIKPAARCFNTTPRTVRKWLRRCSGEDADWLDDRRTISRPRPPKIPAAQREKAIILKKRYPGWGALHLKKIYRLSISDKAIRKIWKEEGLGR